MVRGQSPTILVVEDEPVLRDLYADCLQRAAYEVEQASDSGEAIRSLDRHRPPPYQISVVLLAMTLPVAGGMAVLHHLAELGNRVPVVAVGACAEQLAAARAAGARETVARPVELADLLTLVARHCPRSQSAPFRPTVQHALDRLSASGDALQA